MLTGLQITDTRLEPRIAQKVLAGERLNAEGRPRALSVPRFARPRETGSRTMSVRKRHGRICYFNVNRHINPTNVLRRSLQALRFWTLSLTHQAHTLSLSKRFSRAPRKESPKAPLENFTSSAAFIPISRSTTTLLDLIRGLNQRFPRRAPLKAFLPWSRFTTTRAFQSFRSATR